MLKLTDLLKPIHRKFREGKIRLFLHVMHPKLSDKLLDIGGGFGIAGEFLDLYSYFDRITIANLQINLDVIIADGCILPFDLDVIIADGCILPFGSQSFDYVFSNAVIEHIKTWELQKMFASEIRRVAKKGFFIATPNRYFPLEPHTILPFYQFLPKKIQKTYIRLSPGYLEKYELINLLSVKQLRALFPEASIIKIGPPIIRNNLVAFHRKDIVP